LKWKFLGSESDYSVEDDDDEDFEDEESGSGIKDFLYRKTNAFFFYYYLDASDKLDSDEESGKSWSELEEEARKGSFNF
jgi:hypothetical protein